MGWVWRNIDERAWISRVRFLWLCVALQDLAANIMLTLAFGFVRRMPERPTWERHGFVEGSPETRQKHKKHTRKYFIAAILSALVLICFCFYEDAPCLVFNDTYCIVDEEYHGGWYVMTWLLVGSDVAAGCCVFPILLVYEAGDAVVARVIDWIDELNELSRRPAQRYHMLRKAVERVCQDYRPAANSILAYLVLDTGSGALASL